VKVEDAAGTTANALLFAADSFETTNRAVNKESEGRTGLGAAGDDSLGRTKKGGSTDDSIGRTKKGGSTDDSIGRTKKGGSTDDSIGRPKAGTGSTDDSIGRPKTGTGSTDDSIGRTAKTGSTDDSIGTDVTTGDPVRDSLVGPDSDPARNALRAQIFNSIENPSYTLNVPAGDASVVPALKQHLSDFANQLPTTGRAQLAMLTGKLDEGGLRLMGALVEQDPGLLSDTDTKGGSLLSNLTRLAVQPLNAGLAGDVKPSDLLTSTLRDVVNPDRISQGDAPTCTVTSLQYELVTDSPAEYTRLMADLSGPAGTSVMKGGGALKLDAGDGSDAALEGRSLTDSLFQSAAMEYANGKYADFDPVSGKSTDSRTGAVTQGIHPIQQAALLEQLVGVKYSTKNMYSEAQGQKMLDTLQGFDATAPSNQNRPVILHLDQGTINHAVTLEKVAEGRVEYRDPYGVTRSMPQELFPKYVVAVQQPLQ
jgi:hypothetical protein